MPHQTSGGSSRSCHMWMKFFAHMDENSKQHSQQAPLRAHSLSKDTGLNVPTPSRETARRLGPLDRTVGHPRHSWGLDSSCHRRKGRTSRTPFFLRRQMAVKKKTGKPQHSADSWKIRQILLALNTYVIAERQKTVLLCKKWS